MKHLLIAVIIFMMLPAGHAQQVEAGDEMSLESQRDRLDEKRSQEEARFTAESAACYQRFAVTDCLLKVKTRHYAAMAVLKRQEVALNDAERQIKAAEQLSRIEEKSSPQTLQEQADKRTEALKEQQERLQRADQKAIERGAAITNEESALRERREKAVDREQAAAARARVAREAAENQKNFKDKLREAQEHKADRQKSLAEEPKSSAQPLPAGR
jgi:colicin import membrane protein